MDNALSFSEDNKQQSITEWKFGQSDVSLGETSRLSLQQNLHVVPTNEIKPKKPLITANLVQKLSYFSMYTCNVGKLEILCRQQNNVNRFFWLYISNLLCKSVPMTYVYLFLSSYAPDYHFYIPKMAPICLGCNWIFAITGIFQLIVMMNGSSLYFVYFIMGVIHKVPWNRCLQKSISVDDAPCNCYNLAEFSKKVSSGNVTYYYFFYSSERENFTLAQMEYFDSISGAYYNSTVWNSVTITFSLLWLFAFLSYRQLYKEHVWKILNYSHLALCTFLFVVFAHIVITYENKQINEVISTDKKASEYLMNADFDILAESMTAPPIVHMINSKSVHQIKPSFGSGVISTSNAIMYIFKALTSYLLNKYCERWVNATIIYWNYDSLSPFYIWPIYFATIYFGDFFVLVFFALNAIVDYCVFLLTFHCIAENIQTEWKWIKSWCLDLFIILIIIFDRATGFEKFIENCFITWTGASTLAEAVIIFWIYPLSRFVDDITFHYGTPPSKLRVWSFRIVPIFYLIKMYLMFSRLLIFEDMGTVEYNIFNRPETAAFVQCTLFFIGILLSIYHLVCKKKKGWGQLFKPLPEWGPKDYVSRQLRKQFHSNEFIASQAPRHLSRYLINKAELRSYKVDVRYDSNSRRSTWTKTDHEKIS